MSGAAGGFFGSLGSSAFGAVAGDFANSAVGTIAFGALSGGIGAELSGGNFWQGAVTGGIVAGLNHTLHRAGGEEPSNKKGGIKMKREPWDLDGDGELSLSEANNWYQKANGQEIYVDASKLDLNFVNTKNWVKGKEYGVQTLLKSRNGTVYGNITVKYLGDNRVSILPDIYNFEYHKNSPFRNFATAIGKIRAGKGIQYKINFVGENHIGSKTYRR